MHGCKLIIALFSLMALSGCSTGAKYADTSPTKAITAIANEYGKDRVSSVATRNGASISLPQEAADRTFEAITDYCYARGGRTYDWDIGIVRACVHELRGRELFVIKRFSEGAGMVGLNVVEFTENNRKHVDYYLKSAWNYTTLSEKQREQADEFEIEKLSQEIKRKNLMEKRMSELYKVAYPGAQVCQEIESRDVLGSSTTVLIAVVEQIKGNRIKIFVERAVIRGEPGLSPGGFQKHFAWVNIWDVAPCS